MERRAVLLRPPAPDVGQRSWVASRIGLLEREAARSADTHLLLLELPAFPGVRLYLKDETTHPTGSLKHRLARSLYLYALCNGRLGPGQAVIDASSGSTAISEAWFARLLGLRFTAVMPDCTAPAKVREIRALDGECLLVANGTDCATVARDEAQRTGACFLDQFGLAERATDWRGNNNIAESLLAQLGHEPQPVPDWIVCGAGTGGTSATIGRYLRYRRLPTRLCVAEPAGRAFALGFRSRDRAARAGQPTLIEGVGRPTVEPGFLFEVVDAVEEVADATAIAAAWLLETLLGRRYGGSSGVNLAACLSLAATLQAERGGGSIVTVLGDRGERYAETLFEPGWLRAKGVDPAPALDALCRSAGLAGRRPVPGC